MKTTRRFKDVFKDLMMVRRRRRLCPAASLVYEYTPSHHHTAVFERSIYEVYYFLSPYRQFLCFQNEYCTIFTIIMYSSV